MVMVQDRLEVCEAKIVEVSRDVQSVKVEMQKMQEILMKIKAQGTSSVTNINVNNINSKTEVTKEIETKVKVMIEKWVEKHVEKSQESTKTVIKSMTDKT